jgi:predicted nucleotidyltransferase component of viral defense system
MDAYLNMATGERRLACLKVMEQKRLQAASVDKDFWVCWTLRELFGLQGIGEHITFKGGTSLSKAWGLIERFSEDIDIVVHKEVLGFGGDASPERAPSINQRQRRLEGLMNACRECVQTRLLPALKTSMAKRMGGTPDWKIEVDPDVEDGQCLLFHYPSAFPASEAGYVRPVVKIECGARSDDWPSETCTVTPYVADLFPDAVPDAAFQVSALAAERAFWEKAMLLHETFRPADKPRKERMARHYYDVWSLITGGVADRAAADRELFDRVAEHRQIFFRLGWVDYRTLKPGSLRLTPPAEHRDTWRKDYDEMAEAMFYGERPEFDEILKVVGEFEQRFKKLKASSS